MAEAHDRTWPNRLSPAVLKILFNLYPPYLGTGIHVKTIAPDFRYIEVIMKMRWYNKNYVGTHFGGSIFAMVDPPYMLMLIRNLGSDYVVWDKAATIEFKKPGRGTLKAVFTYTEAEIQAVRAKVDELGRYELERSVDIVNQEGVIVATVVKTIHVSKKRKKAE